MRAKIRFPLKRAILVSDSWPLDTQGGTVEFEREGSAIKAIAVTFAGQPATLAPSVDGAGKMPRVQIGGLLEQRARQVVRRFQDFISLYFQVEVDLDQVDYSYEPENETERKEMNLFGFTMKREHTPVTIPFSLLAQAVFATESDEDPSYVATLLRMGRRNLHEEQSIEAFRYFFMLFEALFGDGKFRKESLEQAFLANKSFVSAIETSLDELLNDNIKKSSPARSLLSNLPDAKSVISLLVERRGFYFHGNIKRAGSWHPDRQKDAKAVAWLAGDIATEVAGAFSDPMHAKDMNDRYKSAAAAKGALMKIEVQFGIEKAGKKPDVQALSLDVPGTNLTSDMAVSVLKNVLDWAEVELLGKKVIYVMARNAQTKEELFQTQFLPRPVKREQG